MGNKKLTEIILFCFGVLLLFIGLWSFIDFNFINEYTLLGFISILSIATYYVAKKDLFHSKTVSNVFSIISLGFSVTSIYMIYYIFDLYSLNWLVTILIGFTIAFYIHEFNIRLVYYVGSFYYLIAVSLSAQYPLIRMSLVNLLGIVFAVYLLTKYINRNPKDLVLQVIVSVVAILSSIICFSELFSHIPMGKIESDSIVSLVLILILGYLVYFGDVKLTKAIEGTLKTALTIFGLQVTIIDVWEPSFSNIVIPIIITIIFTVISLYWHVRGLMDGAKISIFVLVLQFLIISSNVLEFTSFSVFAMILGAFLILVAILVNKNKISKKTA